ncbi:MAG: substrate-binding domain-containing protein, partial [Nitrospinota bacterium]
MPLMRVLAAEFQKANPGITVAFLPSSHSAGGVRGALEGDFDIGLLSRELLSSEKGLGLQYFHLAQDALVFATRPDLNIRNLSREELLNIYSGGITNWREVGGPDAQIVLLDRPEHTSPKIALRRQFFGKSFRFSPAAMALERPTQMNHALVRMKSSIGYASLAEIISENLNVNILSVDGVLPTFENLKNNTYRLSRPFGLVIKERPRREVMKFINFIYGEGGSRIIESQAYLPVLLNLVIGIIPEQNILAQESRYRPLVDYLAARANVGLRIRLKHLASYREVKDNLVSGRISGAFFGSFVFAFSRSHLPLTPIARPEREGVSQYRGLILTRRGSGIRDLRDLRGKSFSVIRATTA